MRKMTIFLVAMVMFLLTAMSAQAISLDVQSLDSRSSVSGDEITLRYHRGETFTTQIEVEAGEDLTDLTLDVPSSIVSEYNLRIEGSQTSSYSIGDLSDGDSTTLEIEARIPTGKSTGQNSIGTISFSSDQGDSSYNLNYRSDSKLVFEEIRNDYIDVFVVSRRSGDYAKPEDEVQVRIHIANEFDDTRIRDIDVDLYVESSDGWDILHEETRSIRSLRGGESSRMTFEFDIPFDAIEDEYDVKVDLRGRDEFGAIHMNSETTWMRVERERNDVHLRKAELSRSTLHCDRTRTHVNIEMYNTGRNDRDDFGIRIENQELGIDTGREDIYLDSIEYGRSRARFEDSFPFSIPEDTEPGEYDIDVRALIGSATFVSETLTLTVDECIREEPQDDDDGDSIVITDPVVPADPPSDEGPDELESENDTVYLILLGMLNVILLVGVIALIVSLPRKKRRRFDW